MPADLSALAVKPTLHGPTIRLVPLDARHTEPMWKLCTDRETNRLTGTRAVFTRDRIEDWCTTRPDQPDRLDLAFEDPATGRGIGTETTLLVLRHAFETVRLHRVHLDVYEYNERAVHAYRKAGFTLAGRARQAHHWDDRYWVSSQCTGLRPGGEAIVSPVPSCTDACSRAVVSAAR
ncbi:GNAT family N-acetyltransferase [Kitasatospora sp. NPDC058190]|uniref:GNAT family N-acetyltransferase n=1 Tax=Kitasatospora sp. NPDC058190 TaxID=3346371 RepID=UPI0036DDF4E4